MMSTVAYPHLTLCTGCDQVHARRPLTSTEWARCRRCGSTLEHGRHFSISTWMALTLTAAILMVFANVFPVAVISLGGLESEATVWQAVVAWGAGRVCGGDDRHWRPGLAGANFTLDIEFRGSRAELSLLRASHACAQGQ